MFHSIIADIICTQFDCEFGRSRKLCEDNIREGKLSCLATESNKAMEIEFSLSPDYEREEGFRNLHILIFGGASNYIGVYAKIDWDVVPNEPHWKPAKGKTPWVLLCYHDSGWRGAVSDILDEERARIITINSLFHGWYKTLEVSDELRVELYTVLHNTPGYGGIGERLTLEALEFKFPVHVEEVK